MRNILALILVVISFQACNDSTESSKILPINKDVGRQIPLNVAGRWIARAPNSGRLQSAFKIPAALFREVMEPTDNKVGVVLQHAFDESGRHHILVSPVLADSQPQASTMFIDSNTESLLPHAIAAEWIVNYEQSNSDKILYHFFGITVVEEILANEYFNVMEIIPAEDDNYKPQLLMFVWNDLGNVSGRLKNEQLVVYDFSYPCPPCANEN